MVYPACTGLCPPQLAAMAISLCRHADRDRLRVAGAPYGSVDRLLESTPSSRGWSLLPSQSFLRASHPRVPQSDRATKSRQRDGVAALWADCRLTGLATDESRQLRKLARASHAFGVGAGLVVGVVIVFDSARSQAPESSQVCGGGNLFGLSPRSDGRCRVVRSRCADKCL